MQGNEYHDIKGHFTDKANDGGACHHDGDGTFLSKEDEENINKIKDPVIKENARKLIWLKEKIRKETFDFYEETKQIKSEAKKLGFDYSHRNNEFTKEIDVPGLPFKPKMTIYPYAPYSSKYKTDFFEKNKSKKELSFDEMFKLSPEELKKFLGEEKTSFDSIDEIKEYFDKTKGSTLKTLKEKNDYINANDEEKVKMMLQNDFNPSLHFSDSKITSGMRIGGYVGQSMSKSAKVSENSGSMPMSKWTKFELFNQIEDEKMDSLDEVQEIKPYLPLLKKIPLKELKNIMLYHDGWHHTGKFYNQTDFYGIDSPRNIVTRLKDYITLHEGLKKGLGI